MYVAAESHLFDPYLHKTPPGGRAGIEAGILSLPVIEYRMRETLFMDDAEHGMAKASVAEDKLWFKALRGDRDGL